ncbi:MAG: ATP-binding protein [bacterium]|nr:ATP-binding protein [bacterium]
MLDTLYIRDFRHFKELTINRLGAVNLFTGKNNSGKSSLIEALNTRKNKNYYGKHERRQHTIQLVPPQGIIDIKITALWDKINLTDLKNEVISGLKLIDPGIQDIALVGDTDDSRIPIARYKGTKEGIPLKTLGDGMTRIFHIILAMVNAKNGVLLIDEFENGLHWNVHSNLWKMIFTLSERLTVQVFATTHSRDCIKGFHEAWSSQKTPGTFHRLEADSGTGARIVEYSPETLTDALETGVEIR